METDKLKSMILEKAHIGIWTIEIEDGSKPRMYADDCMKALLGITEDISPEETYSKWYSRIDPDYYAMVNRCIENVYSEFLQKWSIRGIIPRRVWYMCAAEAFAINPTRKVSAFRVFIRI